LERDDHPKMDHHAFQVALRMRSRHDNLLYYEASLSFNALVFGAHCLFSGRNLGCKSVPFHCAHQREPII
jgi:hypothetical protein